MKLSIQTKQITIFNWIEQWQHMSCDIFKWSYSTRFYTKKRKRSYSRHVISINMIKLLSWHMMKPTINVACQTHRMLEMKRYGIINDQKVNIPKRFLCIHKLQIFTYINAERIFIVQKKKIRFTQRQAILFPLF
jgi:hypothetical protein